MLHLILKVSLKIQRQTSISIVWRQKSFKRHGSLGYPKFFLLGLSSFGTSLLHLWIDFQPMPVCASVLLNTHQANSLL